MASTSRQTLDSSPTDLPSATEGAVDEDDRSLLILYGSQTGTAEDVAERIGREARRHHFHVRVSAMDDVDRGLLLEERLIVFITATTGQGDEPANMKQLWRWLRRGDLPVDLLDGLAFTTFGLGDSSYAKYNWPAKKLHRRLETLGATCFYEKGEGDEQDYLGIDTMLEPWIKGLMAALLQHFPLPPGVEVISPDVRPPPRLAISHNTSSNGSNGVHQQPVRTINATLKRNERATAPDHFQDTRYITFALDEEVHWEPGDVIELLPENAPDRVDAFLTMMKWRDRADHPFTMSASSSDRPLPQHWPHRTTLRELLTSYLDTFSVPRRSFFEFLAYFTSDEQETEKLREFCSAEGQEEMYDYAQRPRRTIAEILQEFRSSDIPLEYVADVFPDIRPRQFSIASASVTSPREVDLLVAIVGYRTLLHAPRTGVCTSWLSGLRVGDQIPVSFSNGTMRLPTDPATPVILIGPGTGVAPFRAFAQARAAQRARDTLVIFGCRSRAKDHYYEEDWTAGQARQELDIVVAASRDQKHKVYVQDKVRERGAEVWSMLERGGYVYISGAADKMPTAVRQALVDVAQTEGKLSLDEAKAYIERLETSRRLQEETWS